MTLRARGTEILITELINLRKESNLSQAALARRIEITENTFRHWEDFHTSPTTDNLVRWAEALGYEFDLHPIDRNQRKNYV